MASNIKMVSSLGQLKKMGPGTYKIPYKVNGKTFNFFVSVGKLDKNASISLNGYGQYGTGRNVLPYLKTNNNGVDVVIQSGGGSSAYETSGWQSAANAFLKDVSKTFNIDKNRTVLSGFSYSAEMTAKYAASYAKATGAKDFSVIVNESSWYKKVPLTDSERQTLIDNNVTIFNVFQNKSRSLYNHMANTKGLHIIDIGISAKNRGGDRHALPFELLMNTGAFNIANGEFDFTKLPKTYNYRGEKLNLVYDFVEHYVDENGVERTRKLTGKQLQDKVKELYAKSLEDIRSQHDNLRDFAAAFSNGESSTLASNLSFVSNAMDEITGKITSHNDLNYQKGSSNEAGVIGALYSSANYYGSVTNELYKNLTNEANAVYAIANAIYKMDACAAVIGETSLTDGVKGLFNSSSISTEVDRLKAASADLFNNAKKAASAAGRFNELSNILGSPITAGGVGKISVTALESAINAIIPSLNSEVEKATGLKSSVDSFMSGIGASNMLQGGAWDEVKSNMASYQNLLDCNVKASEFISDTLKTAMGIIVDYMGEDVELDDSKLPELKTEFDELIKKIDEMNAELSRMKSCTNPGATHTTTDPETGEPQYQQDPPTPCYTDGEISAYASKIIEQEDIKQQLEEDIKKLEGLAPIVEQAQNIINDAISQVKNMYENPVKDANGNETFVADFKLDLSAYGIDTDKDFKKIVDDYYNKLNPKEPPTEEEQDTPDTEYNPTTSGSRGGGGGGGAPTPKLDDILGSEGMETAFEVATEMPSTYIEVTSEVVSEVPTETYEEVITEQPEIQIIDDTPTEEVPINTKKNKIYKNPNYSNYNKNVTKEEVPIINIPDENVVDTDSYYETPIYKPQKISSADLSQANEIMNNIQPNAQEENKVVNTLKTMGIATGISAALGASAVGIYKAINDTDEEEEKDTGYDK